MFSNKKKKGGKEKIKAQPFCYTIWTSTGITEVQLLKKFQKFLDTEKPSVSPVDKRAKFVVLIVWGEKKKSYLMIQF